MKGFRFRYGTRKRIGRDRVIQLICTEKQNVRPKTPPTFNCVGDLGPKGRQFYSWRPKDGIAALDVCFDVFKLKQLEYLHQLNHGQDILAADVDPW